MMGLNVLLIEARTNECLSRPGGCEPENTFSCTLAVEMQDTSMALFTFQVIARTPLGHEGS